MPLSPICVVMMTVGCTLDGEVTWMQETLPLMIYLWIQVNIVDARVYCSRGKDTTWKTEVGKWGSTVQRVVWESDTPHWFCTWFLHCLEYFPGSFMTDRGAIIQFILN